VSMGYDEDDPRREKYREQSRENAERRKKLEAEGKDPNPKSGDYYRSRFRALRSGNRSPQVVDAMGSWSHGGPKR